MTQKRGVEMLKKKGLALEKEAARKRVIGGAAIAVITAGVVFLRSVGVL